MDDEKSVLCNNQVKNQEKDVQFNNDMHENGDSSNKMQYGRDILIQLRLHPMSLEKPVNLPEIEVVKDKLHLNDVVDSAALADKNVDLTTYQSSLKTNYCNLKHEYPCYPHYYSRLNNYSYPYMYNRTYQNASSKFRPSFHTYCNAFKKPCVTKDSSYKNVSDESLWTKQCYMNSEDVWNCHPNHVHTNNKKSKEDADAVPKPRKKLSIIDPVTGKNILEGVTPTPSETNKDTCAVQEKPKCSESDTTSGEKHTGDYFCDVGMIDESQNVSKDFPASYNDDRVFSENENKFFIDQDEFVDRKLKDVSKLEEMSSEASANFSKSENCDVEALWDSKTASEYVHSELKSYQSKKSTPEADKLLSKPMLKFHQAKGSINIHGSCLARGRKGDNSQTSKENAPKENDFVRDNLRQLKEKINTLTHVKHQKMAILQSFLQYKKFKLEEAARNLEEKRIEIANWECNLLKIAKELFEKEQWLNSKLEKLQCKEQQLAELEKSSHNSVNKEAFLGFHDCRNHEKESLLSERKFGLDICSETPWDEVPVSNVYKGDNDEEFAYFSSTPNRLSKNVSSVDASDASSLDELEKNIFLMEKMSSSSETNNISYDDKLGHASFNVSKKEDDIPSCDPLGYSKGRRYLPEHIKYWLNAQDKSAL